MSRLISLRQSICRLCERYAAVVWQNRMLALAMALFWLGSIDIKQNILAPDLDPSWGGVLERDARRDIQFGTEAVYTYGPLGYLYNKQFSPKRFDRQLRMELFLRCLAAIVFFLVTLRLPRGLRWLFVALLVLIPIDSLRLASMICPLLLVSSDFDDHPPLALLFLLLLVPLAMMKFTHTLFLGFAVGAVVAVLALSCRWRFGAAWLALVIVTLLVTWKQIGQSVWNIPAYFVNSLSVTTGYASSMGRPEEPVYTLVGVTALLALAALLFLPLLPLLKRPQCLPLIRTALALSIPGVFAFIAWKHGFTRADPGHTSDFFEIVPFIALSGVACFEIPQALAPFRNLLAALVIACSLIGISLPEDDKFVLSPDAFLERLARNLKCFADTEAYVDGRKRAYRVAQAEAALPRTRETVGDEPVDVYGNQQGYALLNDLELRHRPVFQTFSAYTPRLIDLNHAFYDSERRPKFVMLNLDQFDYRFPPSDDSKALLSILSGYRPLFLEREHLLLEAAGDSPDWQPRMIEERWIKLGEPLDLTGHLDKNLWLAFELHESLVGALRAILYRPPFVLIKLEDASAPLDHIEYLFGRKAAEAGFLASPLLLQRDDIVRLYRGEEVVRPRRIVIDVDARHRWCYRDEFKVRIFELPFPLVASTWTGSESDAAAFNPLGESLEVAEIEAAFPARVTQVESRTALLVHAPSRIRLRAPGTATRVSGFFGLSKGAYKWDRESDGVTFRIEQEIDGRPERKVLLERHLDPLTHSGDRAPVDFDVSLEEAVNGSDIVLSCEPGPGGSPAWDLSAWGEIRFHP